MRRRSIFLLILSIAVLALSSFPVSTNAAPGNPPSAPARVSVVGVTETSIRLEIVAPADNAFSDDVLSFIKLYAVRYGPQGGGGGVKTVLYPDRVAWTTLEGLKPGTAYYIEVFSVNGYDQASAAAGWTTATTNTPPPPAFDAPRVRAVAGDGVVTLTMTEGGLGGGKLAAFEITITGGGVRRTETVETGTYTATNLANGTPYSFSIRVRTNAASGNLSPATVLTRIPSTTRLVTGYRVIAQPASYNGGKAAYVIDASPDAFTGLTIDGKAVAIAHLAVGSDADGRTTIDIAPEALSALGVGEHAVVFSFAQGSANAQLRIASGGNG